MANGGDLPSISNLFARDFEVSVIELQYVS